jgi:hypothetical protein
MKKAYIIRMVDKEMPHIIEYWMLEDFERYIKFTNAIEYRMGFKL